MTDNPHTITTSTYSHRLTNGDLVRIVSDRPGWVSVNTNYNPTPNPGSEPVYHPDARPSYVGAVHLNIGTDNGLWLVEVLTQGSRTWSRRPLSPHLLTEVNPPQRPQETEQ